jgi:hypothetical protein
MAKKRAQTKAATNRKPRKHSGAKPNTGAINPYSGDFYAPAGNDGYFDVRTGDHLIKTGGNQVFNTRTGRIRRRSTGRLANYKCGHSHILQIIFVLLPEWSINTGCRGCCGIGDRIKTADNRYGVALFNAMALRSIKAIGPADRDPNANLISLSPIL